MIHLDIFAAGNDVKLVSGAVKADGIRTWRNLHGLNYLEAVGVENLGKTFPAVGDKQPVGLRHEKKTVRSLEAFNGPHLRSTVQIENLHCAVIFGGEEQALAIEIYGEVVKITGIVGQINRLDEFQRCVIHWFRLWSHSKQESKESKINFFHGHDLPNRDSQTLRKMNDCLLKAK